MAKRETPGLKIDRLQIWIPASQFQQWPLPPDPHPQASLVEDSTPSPNPSFEMKNHTPQCHWRDHSQWIEVTEVNKIDGKA